MMVANHLSICCVFLYKVNSGKQQYLGILLIKIQSVGVYTGYTLITSGCVRTELIQVVWDPSARLIS